MEPSSSRLEHGARITVLSQSPIGRDARVLRQIGALQSLGAVTAIGYGGRPRQLRAQDDFLPITWRGFGPLAKMRSVGLLSLARTTRLRAFDDAYYWSFAHHREMWQRALGTRPELVVANDWDTLMVATRLRSVAGCRVILDLHEHAPLQYDHEILWRALRGPAVDRTLRRHMASVDAAFTVSPLIAEQLTARYGKPFGVVRNIPQATSLPPFRPTDTAHIRLVHHGVAARARLLERMIEVIAQLDTRFQLHFLLVDKDGYQAELQRRATRIAPGRVHFHPPVPPDQIVERISEYDVGLYLLRPTNTNNRLALPNKFFEFVTAGLGTCTGPSPEMAALAREFGFGIVSPGFETAEMAARLGSLDAAKIDRLKRAAIEARHVLNSESELAAISGAAERLLCGFSEADVH